MNDRSKRASYVYERKLREGDLFNEEQIEILKTAFEDGIECLYNDLKKEKDSNEKEKASTNWLKAKEY